jgi:coatomer subunit zeta
LLVVATAFPLPLHHLLQALETPTISAIIVQDTEGGRIASKFFSRADFPSTLSQTEFEKRLFKKIKGSAVRSDAEVLTLDGFTVV